MRFHRGTLTFYEIACLIYETADNVAIYEAATLRRVGTFRIVPYQISRTGLMTHS